MSRQCEMTGRKRTIGNNVSHSKRRTKKLVYPNLQTKKVLNPATGRTIRVKLSTTAIKTLAKWQKAGKVYDLSKLLS